MRVLPTDLLPGPRAASGPRRGRLFSLSQRIYYLVLVPLPGRVAVGAVGGHEGDESDDPAPAEEAGHLSDPPYRLGAVSGAEAQVAVEPRAHLRPKRDKRGGCSSTGNGGNSAPGPVKFNGQGGIWRKGARGEGGLWFFF